MRKLSRTLNLNNGGQTLSVPIDVSWPAEAKNSWSCDWEIRWPDRVRSGTSHGVDAIQTLVNALQMIGTEIHNSTEHQSGRLWWHKELAGYGFPVPSTIRDLLKEDDRRFL